MATEVLNVGNVANVDSLSVNSNAGRINDLGHFLGCWTTDISEF